MKYAWLLCILLLPACGPAPDPAADWLIGSWTLVHNPEQDDHDVLIFKPGGTLDIDTESGRTIQANYLIQEDELIIVFVKRGQPVEARFRIAADKTRLIYSNGAIYHK